MVQRHQANLCSRDIQWKFTERGEATAGAMIMASLRLQCFSLLDEGFCVELVPRTMLGQFQAGLDPAMA